jgi:hypothetical protein
MAWNCAICNCCKRASVAGSVFGGSIPGRMGGNIPGATRGMAGI